MLYTVAHLADIQINCNAKNSDRTAEYSQVLTETAKEIVSRKFDAVVIAGDVFERYDTTDTERELYVRFIHAILAGLPHCHVIVIDGNHDLRKRNLTHYDGIRNTAITTVLEEINSAINNPRYYYSREPKLYEVTCPDGTKLDFACWSEYDLYATGSFGAPYDNDTVEQLKKSRMVIDVFHGTLAGAKDLGTAYEPEPDQVKLQGHCAMLGHIHKYQQLGNAIYCSSLVQRTFNEGIRYNASQAIYDYRNDHGFVQWTIDTEAKTANALFVPIHQPTLLVTFVMDQAMTKDALIAWFKLHANDNLQIKLVLDHPNPEALAFAYNYCKSKPNFNIKKVESVALNAATKQQMQMIDDDKLELDTPSMLAIASELLRPVLLEQHSNDINYAKAVFDKTLALLEQECGYHLHPENRSSILMQSVIIDNFKTIGHAEFQFDTTGLTALRGQNGQGKTTCFEAIAFALTGQHNATFKRNAKNKQFIRLFNDKQPDNDVVKIVVNFSINGTEYSVICMLQKFMDADWQPSNWKSHVNRVNKTLQIFKDDDVEVASGDEADKWLQNYFGDYADFAILHMIDQNTLDSIKFMSPDDLSNFILQRLGYSVISKFQYYYQGCKNNELVKTPKPTEKTYVDLCADIDSANMTIQSNNDAIAEQNKFIAEKQQEIDAARSEQERLLGMIVTVPEQLIAGWQQDIIGYDEQTIDNQITAKQEELHRLQEQQNEDAKLTEQYKTKHQSITELAAQLVKQATEYYSKQLEELTKHQQSVMTKYNELNKENQDITEKTTSYNACIQHAKDLILQYSRDLTEVDGQLTGLKPNICPTCGQAIDSTMFEQYKSSLETRKDNIQHQIDEQNATIIETEQKLKELPAKYDIEDLHKQSKADIEEIAKINGKLAKLTTVDYQMQVVQSNHPEAYTEYEYILQRYNQIDSTLSSKVQTCQAQLEALNKAKTAFSQLVMYKQVLNNNELTRKQSKAQGVIIDCGQLEINKANNCISGCKATIAKMQTAIDNAEDMKLQVVAYNISQEALQHYKWLIYTALPRFLYQKVCSIVNMYIDKQDLPATIRPHLSEEVFGQLVLRDRMFNGEEVQRPILEASGMEITIAGLIICFAMHNAKLAIDFPMVLLDELSGKLNQGDDKDDTDYVQLLTQILQSASKQMQIVMIDHRITDDKFDKIVKVYKDKITNVSYIQ